MIKLAVVMDPIAHINIKKDSTFAILMAAQARHWTLYYIESKDLYVIDGIAKARVQALTVSADERTWYQLGPAQDVPLAQFDIILMRKDPPFNTQYIYTTYILELAAQAGSLVVNNPQSLRDANEKLFCAYFPHCCPPTLVTCEQERIKVFLETEQHIVVKPLDGMGGSEIFVLKRGDPNNSVILETITRHNQRTIMAQRYLPAIRQGDKRIILVNGEAIPYALMRIPLPGELRGNLAAGANAKVLPLSNQDRWICKQVGPKLKDMGLILVGLDVIGDKLTEINVTSPTGLVEIAAATQVDICGQLLDSLQHTCSINHSTPLV